MNAKEKFQEGIERYVQKHAEAVTPEMIALWHQWIAEGEQHASSQEKQGYLYHEETMPERKRLADKYLTGEGIEIGALNSPLHVPSCAKVRYVDRSAHDDLKYVYFDASHYDFVEVDVIDDGETLGTFEDGSVDFVISSHLLEHCEDPIGSLLTHLRVLKPGGILFCAVPDCRATFDAEREVTDFEHLWRDHTEGPARSREAHLRDYTEKVSKKTGFEFEAGWRMLDAGNISIHYHVWTPMDVLEIFLELRKRMELSFDIREFSTLPGECVVIVEKT